MRKGQVIVTDIIIAVGLFMIMIVFLLYTLNYYNTKLQTDLEFDDLSQKAMSIADFLAFSPGVPSNWTTTNVIRPGIVDQDRNVSYYKLINFTHLSQQQIKDAFKINLYSFRFTMYYYNGSSIAGIGDNYSSQVNLSATSRRDVLYGKENAYVEFIVWK